MSVPWSTILVNREREGPVPMRTIHTKNGRPLHVNGEDVFSKSGKQVARLRGGTAYGPDGQYVGTLDGDRLVYRSTDSATISSPFVPMRLAGFATANAVRSALWGDEPLIS